MPIVDFDESTSTHAESRTVAAIVGLITAIFGFSLAISKLMAKQSHLRAFHGGTFGAVCWKMAVLSSGIFLGGLGLALFLKAVAGRWNWKQL